MPGILLGFKKYPTSDELYDDCPIVVHQLQKTLGNSSNVLK